MEGFNRANKVIRHAIELDDLNKHVAALEFYQDGIKTLLDLLKQVEDEQTKISLQQKIDCYMARAEKLKAHINEAKAMESHREKIEILDNTIGHSYDNIFSKFLNRVVTKIEVDDPYIHKGHQIDNFVRFTELCISRCPNLKTIVLTTTPFTNEGTQRREQQQKGLDTIGKSMIELFPNGARLVVNYPKDLHAREIRIDNGWVIKIDRGLDFYKPIDKYKIGSRDFNFRPCKLTIIDIYYNKELHRCPP